MDIFSTKQFEEIGEVITLATEIVDNAKKIKKIQEQEAEKLYTVQLTKYELHKCISYLTAARRKSCSVFIHGILGSVIGKLKEARK